MQEEFSDLIRNKHQRTGAKVRLPKQSKNIDRVKDITRLSR